MTHTLCLGGTDYQTGLCSLKCDICHMCNIFNPVNYNFRPILYFGHIIRYQLSGHVTYCDDFVTLLLFESVTK